MANDFEYINRTYGLQTFKGQTVRYKGQKGRVTGTSGPHVKIVLDGQKRVLPYHPTDEDLVYADFAGNFPGEENNPPAG